MNSIKRLFKYIKPFRWIFVIALVSAFIGILLSLFVPVLIGRGVDCIIGKDDVDFTALYYVCIEMLVVVIVSALFQWLMAFFSNKLSYLTVSTLRSEVFDKFNRLPLKFIDSTSKGDLINSVVTDIDIISTGLLQGFTQVLSGVVTILGTIVLMFVINPIIALVVVLLTPLSFFVASVIAKKSHKKYSQQAKLRGELTGFASEVIDSAEVVTAFNMQDTVIEKYENINKQWQKVGILAHFYSALSNPCTRFVNAIVYAAVAIFGAVTVVGGGLSVGALASFLAYCSQYTKPFNEISAVVAEFQNAVSSAERVFRILDTNEETEDENLPSLENVNGNVNLKDVTFSYNKNKPFIQNLNLNAPDGKVIALVGPTGCGKTTLINLLMRFYELDEGEILLDGNDISKVNRQSLRKQFGMVLQDTWLFSGTIFENIAYGKENATFEQVVEASKKAYAHSFIQRLPDGYETIITGNGDNLSHGQKQLICIARVMLLDPPILILDEATSSIDTRTEIKIQKAFLELMQGRTSFIVAHRLSTIRNADEIIVMKDGEIIEKGTHDKLIEKDGFYRQLYNSQFTVY